MFNDSFPYFEAQVESTKFGVAQLEIFHDAKRVQVVVECQPVAAHGCIQRLLTGVTKGRMSDVMHQGQGFDEISVQAQRPGNGPRDLRDFNGVRQAVAEVV